MARNQDWKSPERLWRQTVLASPLSPRAHNNMGDVYGTEGNIEGALQEFKTSVTLKPDYSDGFHNLANTYQRQGNFTEAVKYYKLAVTFNPLLGESYFNLGVIYLNRQEYDPAIESFRKVCELWPNDQSVKSALDIAIKRKNNAK